MDSFVGNDVGVKIQTPATFTESKAKYAGLVVKLYPK